MKPGWKSSEAQLVALLVAGSIAWVRDGGLQTVTSTPQAVAVSVLIVALTAAVSIYAQGRARLKAAGCDLEGTTER